MQPNGATDKQRLHQLVRNCQRGTLYLSANIHRTSLDCCARATTDSQTGYSSQTRACSMVVIRPSFGHPLLAAALYSRQSIRIRRFYVGLEPVGSFGA